MRFGLVQHSFNSARCSAYELMERAASTGLRGVEFMAESALPSVSPDELARARAFAAERDLSIVASGGYVGLAELDRWIPQARALGARVLRVVLSPILAGDRNALDGGWSPHLGRCEAILRETRPLLEKHDVTLAIENHQDITSEELLRLCDSIGGNHVGVTLDTGSTLAVGEETIQFTQKVRHLVQNVHLKDYTTHLSPSGYRLARCSMGDGAIDFPTFFALFADRPELPMGIEVGATVARHVQLLSEEWWRQYPPRPALALVPALRVAFGGASAPDVDWRTPHERGESEELRIAYELRQYRESVIYLKRVEPVAFR